MTTPPADDPGMLPDDPDFAVGADPVDEQAAAWLVRLTSGHATDAERAAFAQWRDADPAHAEAFSRLRAIWGVLPASLARSMPQTAAPAPSPTAAVAGAAPRRARRRLRWALAASLLAGVAVATYQAQRSGQHDLVTASGERRTIALDDGSSMVLGGDTALDVERDGAQRRLTLVRGEAYFEVRSDRGRAFVVDAGSARVEVLGTRFSVRRDEGAGEVTVVEGRVRVRVDGDEVLLEANQRAGFDPEQVHPAEATDADEALAWRSGRLVINDATLGDVAALLNRHRAGVVLVRPSVAQGRRINAVIDLDRADAWLAALEPQGIGRVVRLGSVTLIY